MNEWLVRHTANNKIHQLCQHKCRQSTGKPRLAREFLSYLWWLMPSKKAVESPAYLCAYTPGRYYFLKSDNTTQIHFHFSSYTLVIFDYCLCMCLQRSEG